MPDPTEAETAELESSDSFDDVLRRVVATSAPKTLELDSLLQDRYRIRRLLGVGGMGAVYLAHDLTLVRDVAIKIHHTTSNAARLRREAVAMARLAHPNVVTVFEYGEVDGHPFVVMEYVTGTTLRSWLGERPRTVSETLEVLVAAGRGLAAAHDAGLVHRDFKPENVMIGSDGRARVGDFGLARDVDSDAETTGGLSELPQSTITQTGSMVGTPAYMAPEQLAGRATIDARADQFAFCVTVWEALWKERPFAGRTVQELVRAIESGEHRPPPSSPRVPARVRAALERGLATNGDDRFASMHLLLAELRPRTLTRRRLALVVGTLAITGGGAAWFVSRGGESAVSCANAGAAAVELVPRDLPAKLRAIGDATAAERVESAVTTFSNALASGSKSACEAGRLRREWSSAIMAKSESCFLIAARSARYLLDYPTVDKTNRDEVVRRARLLLPDLSGCTSPTFLSASPAMPSDPRQLQAVIEALADRDTAYLEIASHRVSRAGPHLERLEKSVVRDLPQVASGHALLQGALAKSRGDSAAAEKQLADAYYAARAIDDDQGLTMALTLLLKIAIDKQSTDPFVAMWIRTAVADAERLSQRAPWLSARLYIATASVADATGDSETALRQVARIRELAPDRDPILAAASSIEGAVLIWSGRVDQGSIVYERAIAEEIAIVGPEHPRVGSRLSDYAVLLLGAGRSERALEVAKQAVSIVEAAVDPDDRLLDGVRVNLAAVLAEIGSREERVVARALLESARAHYVAHEGEVSSWVANIDMNIASSFLADGNTGAAIDRLERALATTEQVLGPDRIEVAEVLFNIAAARRMDARLEGALDAARRCAGIYAAQRPGTDRHRAALAMLATIENQLGDHAAALATTATAIGFSTPVQDPQAVAWSQLERGRALIATGRSREARAVLEPARASYETIGLPDRVREIDALLAKTR